MAGYRTASHGSVDVLGFDPGRSAPAMYERTGIVLQECGIQDDLSVGELLVGVPESVFVGTPTRHSP